jgi:hypothetical protein
MIIIPNPKDNHATRPNNWKIFQPLPSKLLTLVNLTAFLTIVGFFVVQSYISSFSNLFSFNISVTQYLAAGINLVLALAWYVALSVLAPSIALVFIVVAIVAVFQFFKVRNRNLSTTWDNFRQRIDPIVQRLIRTFRPIWIIGRFMSSIGFVIFIVLVSLVYGTYYYHQSPRMFGGGMPATVILVFKEEQLTQNSPWSFSISQSNPKTSEPVELLIELTDGIVVRHLTTNVVAIVKNDVIQGVIDASTTHINVTTPSVTPNQQATSTPTP